jgi:3',5'-cyclic AMP phosphodiesterase CpdA
MPEFRLTQISDTHLARRLSKLTDNFDRVRDHIDATRPDLVVNSGDLAFDGPTNRDDLDYAKTLHDALPVACRFLTSATTRRRSVRRRLNRSPKRASRRTARSSGRTAGVLKPPAGVSSASIRWS